MPIYKTLASLLKAGYEQPSDCIGEPLDVGDRISLVHFANSIWKAGQKATVKGFQTDSFQTIGVEFDTPSPEGHSCGGLCADKRGRWLRPEEINKVSLKLETNEEEVLATLKAELDKSEHLLCLKGKYYSLKATRKPDSMLEPILSVFSKRILAERQKAQSALIEAKQALEKVKDMPDLSIFDLKKHIYIFSPRQCQIGWICPFEYKPQFIASGSSPANQEINKPMQEKLYQKDLQLEVDTAPSGQVLSASLLDSKFGFFHHYQGSCLGTVNPGSVENVEELLKLRDLLQVYFHTLNSLDVPCPNPTGLPSWAEVREQTTPIKPEEIAKKVFQTYPPVSLPPDKAFKPGDVIRFIPGRTARWGSRPGTGIVLDEPSLENTSVPSLHAKFSPLYCRWCCAIDDIELAPSTQPVINTDGIAKFGADNEHNLDALCAHCGETHEDHVELFDYPWPFVICPRDYGEWRRQNGR